MSRAPEGTDPARAELAASFVKADHACPFGPSFFLGHLGRFVRDHCPSTEEHLPKVQIRLADGESLDLCHVIGVSPRWVMLATRESGSHQNEMAIDFVPFEVIQGVHIRAHHAETTSLGFAHGQSPAILSAETLVDTALTSGREPRA